MKHFYYLQSTKGEGVILDDRDITERMEATPGIDFIMRRRRRPSPPFFLIMMMIFSQATICHLTDSK